MTTKASYGALKVFWNSIVSDDSPSEYPVYTTGEPIEIAALVQADLNVTTVKGTFAANDNAEELSAEEWSSAVVALQTSEFELDVAGKVFGQSYDETTKTLSKKGGDTAPAGGMTYIKKYQDANKKQSFRVMFVPKLQAAVPSDSAVTKGSSITFSTKTTNFNVSRAKNDVWNDEIDCATLAEAETKAKELLTGATPSI